MTAWIEQWRHLVVNVAGLPLPQEIERPACMAGRRLPGLHRLVRQIAPRPQTLDCCSYHSQDWALASETAIRLLGQVTAGGLAGQAAADRVMELVRTEGISEEDAAAIECLVDSCDPLQLDDDGEINEGRHRIQAMIDQGVRRTVLLRLELLDPATGRTA